MRSFYTLLFSLFIPCLALSQSIIYEYDSAGNRIKRIHQGGSLPVNLVSFKAAKEEYAVLLEWQTASETNSSHFEVERSREGNDWSGIGQVPAKGEAYAFSHYRHIDHSPMDGLNIYRLKMVDQDGTFSYSKLESVYFSQDLSVYPNPVQDFLRIREPDDVVLAEVISPDGKLIFSVNKIPDSGVDFRSLPAGLYLIKIYRRAGTATVEKVIRK